MMRRMLIIFGTGIYLLSMACGGAGIDGRGPEMHTDFKTLVGDAKHAVSEVSVEELRTKLDNEEEFLLIDIREPHEFEESWIDGAFNLPRGRLEMDIDSEDFWDSEGMYVPEKDEMLILYSVKGRRSALAAQTLETFGYTNVHHVPGGWLVWEHGPDALQEEEAQPEESGCG